MRRVLTVITISAIGLLPVPATAQTVPSCFGMEVTILGTEGPDSVAGTSGHDVISVLGADDNAHGSDDPNEADLKDWICGGTGSDGLAGFDGNDWLDGERGNDAVVGDDGQDRLFGGGGSDFLLPYWGSDFADGGEGDDTIQNDRDRAVRWSSDTLRGGEGSDLVGIGYAPTGSDALYGDGGNDVVDGRDCQVVGGCRNPEPSSTPDLVDGGSGRDRCRVDDDDTWVNCEIVNGSLVP